MQRIINDPNLVVEDMLKGFLKCHKDRLHADPKNPRTIVSNSFNEKPKVGIVTGGGSGHKPAFIGYCGRNMVDAVAVGEIFSSPTAEAFEQCIRAVDQGLGVAVLYGNYAGDNMNVKMAKRAVEKDGIAVKLVVANDDVPSDPVDRSKRRGVAGEIMMWKCGGAKAAMGGNLDEVIACAQKAIDNTRSAGIGLGPCTIPANGKPNFSIEPGTMEVGIGHHGEPGVRVEPLKSADEMAQEMVDIVLPDLPFVAGDEVVVLVSGLGATPIMEQYIFFSKVYDLIEEKGISIYKSYVGDYFTSLEMNGITLTVMKLDDELKACIDMPVECDGLTQFGSMPIAETVAAAPVAAASAKVAEVVEDAPAKVKAARERVGATIANAGGAAIALAICDAIHEKAAYLSEVDGETGDGDHGINMNKGFLMAKERISDDMSLTEALGTIGDTLVKDIGGSMGPIYGTFFETLADGLNVPEFDAIDLKETFGNVVDALKDLAGAKEGDKTLIDTAAPASRAFSDALGAGKTLGDAFKALADGAAKGLESTRSMQAKIGRAARLGERSIGHLDAGATSCDIIIETLAKELGNLL
ncbi:MAG: dihydroxyacetone kinase subunit L [Atopobiaceae bacterium]|nr:dihydroxyacetone kinase subunit L [Atopobiaceae bacterium]